MLVFHVMGRPEVGMDKIKRQVHPRMAAKASGKRRAMDRRRIRRGLLSCCPCLVVAWRRDACQEMPVDTHPVGSWGLGRCASA